MGFFKVHLFIVLVNMIDTVWYNFIYRFKKKNREAARVTSEAISERLGPDTVLYFDRRGSNKVVVHILSTDL